MFAYWPSLVGGMLIGLSSATLLVLNGRIAGIFERSGSYSAFSWVDGGLRFAVVAGTDRTSLLGIAQATCRQLDPTRPPGIGQQPR